MRHSVPIVITVVEAENPLHRHALFYICSLSAQLRDYIRVEHLNLGSELSCSLWFSRLIAEKLPLMVIQDSRNTVPRFPFGVSEN